MSRILRGHQPATATLARIAEVLEVSPVYLAGGYQLPAWLTEEDVLTLADQRNVPLLQVVREAAEHSINESDLKKLINIIMQYPCQT